MLSQPQIAIIIALLLLALPNSKSLAASKIYGSVVEVTGGDTIIVLTPMRKQLVVRLAEIDAPEINQPYGETSKRFLSATVLAKEVVLLTEVKDSDGRAIARVFVGAVDVNLHLVKNGTAWAFRPYVKDEAILRAEHEARKAKVGLWGLHPDQIVPPWEWSKRR